MAPEPILGTEDFRRDLAQVLAQIRVDPRHVVTIGRHRRPEAVLVSYAMWQEVSGGIDHDAGAHGEHDGDLSWDPADGVAYEVAESVLGDLISYCARELWAAEHVDRPDPATVTAWRDRLTSYAQQRRNLTISDPSNLRAVIERFGAELREVTGRASA